MKHNFRKITSDDTINLTDIAIGNICVECGYHYRGPLTDHLTGDFFTKEGDCPAKLDCCESSKRDDRFFKSPCPGLILLKKKTK